MQTSSNFFNKSFFTVDLNDDALKSDNNPEDQHSIMAGKDSKILKLKLKSSETGSCAGSLRNIEEELTPWMQKEPFTPLMKNIDNDKNYSKLNNGTECYPDIDKQVIKLKKNKNYAKRLSKKKGAYKVEGNQVLASDSSSQVSRVIDFDNDSKKKIIRSSKLKNQHSQIKVQTNLFNFYKNSAVFQTSNCSSSSISSSNCKNLNFKAKRESNSSNSNSKASNNYPYYQQHQQDHQNLHELLSHRNYNPKQPKSQTNIQQQASPASSQVVFISRKQSKKRLRTINYQQNEQRRQNQLSLSQKQSLNSSLIQSRSYSHQRDKSPNSVSFSSPSSSTTKHTTIKAIQLTPRKSLLPLISRQKAIQQQLVTITGRKKEADGDNKKENGSISNQEKKKNQSSASANNSGKYCMNMMQQYIANKKNQANASSCSSIKEYLDKLNERDKLQSARKMSRNKPRQQRSLKQILAGGQNVGAQQQHHSMMLLSKKNNNEKKKIDVASLIQKGKQSGGKGGGSSFLISQRYSLQLANNRKKNTFSQAKAAKINMSGGYTHLLPSHNVHPNSFNSLEKSFDLFRRAAQMQMSNQLLNVGQGSGTRLGSGTVIQQSKTNNTPNSRVYKTIGSTTNKKANSNTYQPYYCCNIKTNNANSPISSNLLSNNNVTNNAASNNRLMNNSINILNEHGMFKNNVAISSMLFKGNGQGTMGQQPQLQPLQQPQQNSKMIKNDTNNTNGNNHLTLNSVRLPNVSRSYSHKY